MTRARANSCVTSNVKTQTVSSAEDHHVGEWLALATHPLCVCTDDKGVFETSASDEHACVAAAFKLSRRAMLALARRAVDCAFATPDERARLVQALDEFQQSAFTT